MSMHGILPSALPLELILAVRGAMERHQFDRRVVGRMPYTIDMDAVELDCGHTAIDPYEYEPATEMYCFDCRQAWIDERLRQIERGGIQ